MFDNFNYLWHDDDSLDNFLLELRDCSDNFVIDGDADGWAGFGNFDRILLCYDLREVICEYLGGFIDACFLLSLIDLDNFLFNDCLDAGLFLFDSDDIAELISGVFVGYFLFVLDGDFVLGADKGFLGFSLDNFLGKAGNNGLIFEALLGGDVIVEGLYELFDLFLMEMFDFWW